MSDNIEKLPPLPPAILEAANNGKLAVFIGAGVSRLVGCLGWDELAKKLVEKCFKSSCKDGTRCISYKEKETLLNSNDHKKTISICRYILDKYGLLDEYNKELEKALTPDKTLLEKLDIYKELYGLHGLFITTNADEIFQNSFRNEQVDYKHFDSSRMENNKLYHIHGLISDRESLVFTIDRYIERYNEKGFVEFLRQLYEEYTVLFVGYGMNEFEQLDFVIRKAAEGNKNAVNRFILLPFYKGEDGIFDFEKNYYGSMGVQLIGYEKDINGYEQLYQVIQNWNKEINQLSTYLYNSLQKLEDAANNYSVDKVSGVMQIIKNDEPQRDHFFEELAFSANPFPWLSCLIEEGYFNPRKNPVPYEVKSSPVFYTVPVWTILKYLENVSIKNEESQIKEITEKIVIIIDSIIEYRDDNGQRVENFRTDAAVIRVFACLPKEYIKKQYIEFVRLAIESKWNIKLIDSEIGKLLLPKLIEKEAIERILDLLDILLDYKGGVTNFDENSPLVDSYWLEVALAEHKPAIAKLCGVEAAKKALDIMAKITKSNKIHFNNVWIPTIEDYSQNDFKDRYDCQLVYFIRDMMVLSKPEQTKGIIENLLLEDHPIFKRIALFTIDQHYDDLNGLFWDLTDNPLEKPGIKHELYELLKNNCKQFSVEQLKKVLDWIESKDYTVYSNHSLEQQSRYLAYKKKEWLTALGEAKDERVAEAYEKYNAIEPSEHPHPGLNTWLESYLEEERAPKIVVEISGKTNYEIAAYLKSFKPTGEWGDTTLYDVQDGFRKYITNNPDQFSMYLNPFLDISHNFQCSLFLGLSESWKTGKDYSLVEIFSFILAIIKSEKFWEEATEAGDSNNEVINEIVNFIKTGTRDDKHSFGIEFLSIVEEVLLILAKRTKSDITETEDIITTVLNSTKGNIFEAMVFYSLKHYRLHKSEKNASWVTSIRDDFTMRLDREIEPTIEFPTTIGRYLNYIYTLDKNWVIDNIDFIFPFDDAQRWKVAFTGYTFGMSQVNKDLYILLRDKGHYNNALTTTFSDKNTMERIVDQICVGYLEDWEKLENEDSLITELLNSGSINQIVEIVSFFWMHRKNVSDNIKNKIKPLWKSVLDKLVASESQYEYKRAISDIIKWVSLVDEIDEQVFGYLEKSVKYLEVNHNSPFLVEYLSEHVSSTPSKVGQIYLKILEEDIFPEYDKGKIQKIVETLYKKGEKEMAYRICNIYLLKGITFLNSLYEQYKELDR